MRNKNWLTRELANFLDNLQKKYQIYAPTKEGRDIYIRLIDDKKKIDFSGIIPVDTFKPLFLPPRELIYISQKKEIIPPKIQAPPVVAFGMNILDLKALALFDQTFEKDPYYQKRRANILVIGFSAGIPADYRRYRVFSLDYEENVLEHLIFDIFIERQTDGNFKFFSGSREGQKVLEESGVSVYEHIEFAGLVPEEGPDKRMLRIREKLASSQNHPLWRELDEICLACGKCTIACPTCFCFDLHDEPGPREIKRVREWGSCFYPEFSEIAGGTKFLKTIKDKIFFWYYHKFVRIPDELSLPGCVSCNRCTRVCPVGINIQKNIQRLLSDDI